MKPSEMFPEGTLIGNKPLSHADAVYEKEKKTHRHLKKGEVAKAGDVYGGEDWGFLFEVVNEGEPYKGTNLRPGHLVDNFLVYRIRRPL